PACFVRWYRRGEFDWDYAVFTVTGIAPEYLRNPNVFPPKNCVHTVDVDGVPIAVVLKRDNKYDLEATKLKKAGQLDSAKTLYLKSLENDPLDETALINLAEIYLNKQQPDSCLMMTGKYLNEIEPSNDEANYFSAYANLMKGNAQKAVEITENIIKHNYKYGGAYQLQLQIYLQSNNLFGAEQTMVKMIDIDMVDNNFVATWVAINKAQGLDERGAYIKLYKALVDSYNKRGKKKEAEMYQEQLEQLQQMRQKEGDRNVSGITR
ncbi:MAG: tetratricopeptide repeat protein, partial [Bacteroidales bacterium]|nr:tetratricopeptide repeat protein [Bacteroidales bacterium]